VNPTRCACCHRYAPKGHESGDPVGECHGHANLMEARDIARAWKARALKAGWVKPTACVNCGGPLKPCNGVAGNYCPACLTGPPGPQHPRCKMADVAITPEPGHALNARRDFKYPHERTLEQKMADHLADCIAKGKPLIYCQGPKRHHAVVDTPMGDQMVNRGCFHCDAFPEIQG